jgi:hypothetical protein
MVENEALVLTRCVRAQRVLKGNLVEQQQCAVVLKYTISVVEYLSPVHF